MEFFRIAAERTMVKGLTPEKRASFLTASVSLLFIIALGAQVVSASSWDAFVVVDRVDLTRRSVDWGEIGDPELIATLGRPVACTAMLSPNEMLAAISDDTSIATIDIHTGALQPLVDVGLYFAEGGDFAIATAPDGRVWISESIPIPTPLTTLYLADLSSGALSVVGIIGTFRVDDLVYHDSKLYAAAFNVLYDVNPLTAQPTIIIEHPVGEMELFFTELGSDGENLWAVTNSVGFPGPVFRRLSEIDPDSGEELWGHYMPDLFYVDLHTLDVRRSSQEPSVPAMSRWGAATLIGLVALIGVGILRVGAG